MNKLSLTESELKEKMVQIYKEEQVSLLDEKWNKLSGIDRQFVLEFLKILYPEKSMLVTEARWYNTVGDIVGIFDPTPITDTINGISYWRQGDKLFALLSFISAVPMLGDAIAKPVVGALKIGGESAKAFKAAAVGGDALKIAGTAKTMGGPVAELIKTAPSWVEKLVSIIKNSVGKVPGLGGLIKVIEEYVSIFSKAGKEMEAGGKVTAFSKNAGELQSFSSKYLSGGVGRFFGNRATRSLMRRSKWYLKLLDFLGVHNFIGPDELEKQIPNLESKMNEFNQTPRNQELFNQEFGNNGSAGNLPSSTTSQPPTQNSSDPFSGLLSSLLGGAVKAAI
jgi:hypothetical protein